MAASYPGVGIKSFAPIVDGVDYPQATQVNQAYDEITAIETALLTGGLAHNLTPDSSAGARTLGTAAKKFAGLFLADGAAIANVPMMCEGRLTLTTALAVTTSDVTAAGTIYFTPYGGCRITIFDGTNWTVYTFTEKSLALTLTSGKNYDVFANITAGAVALELSAAWTNDTTRADALALQDGVWVKSGTTTRRLLGTIRASGANTTEDSDLKRFVWNLYNRVLRRLRVVDATNTWAWSTATYQQANASAANQVALVIGIAEDVLDLSLHVTTHSNGTGGVYGASIGEDATNAPASGVVNGFVSGGISVETAIGARLVKVPTAGYHYYPWIEIGAGSGVQTFEGDNGLTTMQSGLIGWVKG